MHQKKIDYEMHRVPEEWILTKGKGSVVMISDTACDETHECLSGKIVEQRSFLRSTNIIGSVNHCTHLCGIICGESERISGVATDASIMVAQTMSSSTGDLGALKRSLEWADEVKPDVLNLSISYSMRNKSIESLLDKIYKNGTIIIAANGRIPRIYPASYDSVISVGAFGDDNRAFNDAEFYVQREFLSSIGNNEYAVKNGCSMSSAFISGIAALAKSFDKSMTSDEFVRALR